MQYRLYRNIKLMISGEMIQEQTNWYNTTIQTNIFIYDHSISTYSKYENVDKTSLYLLHTVCVFFISILLLNFLIATMTQSFSEVYTHRRAITQTQILALMMAIQFRLSRPMRALYKILQGRVFVYHDERLCLRRTLIKGKNLEPISLTPGNE